MPRWLVCGGPVVVNPSLFDKAILFEAPPTLAAQGQRMNEK